MVAQRVSFCNRMEGGSPIHYMIKVYSLAEPVNTKEYVKCGKYRPFVVVHKRVTVQQALHQDVSLFHTIGVIAGIEADRRTPPRHIPNTGSPTAAFEQYDMQTKGIGSYKIIPAHLSRAS